MLEAQPALGRLYSSGEELEGHSVVLSDAFWQRRFGGDRSVVNQSIALDGQNYTVIGVMPPGFQFPHASFSWAEPADVWLPLNPRDVEHAGRRGPYRLNVLARLAPGVRLEQARTHMNALAQRFEREQPGYRGPNGEDGGWHITVTPLQEEIVGSSRRACSCCCFQLDCCC
jgi:putative ABC transport system permease protein